MNRCLNLPASPDLPLLHDAVERRLLPSPLVETHAVHCTDGRVLDARVFRPLGSLHGTVLIGGATGVPQRFYGPYARWLAAQGLLTLTFDYRGIRGSRITPLRDDPARMRDWGSHDLPAALDHLHQLAPTLPIGYIGHSVGGQMLGLMPNHALIHRAVMLASGFGYWGNMAPLYGTMVRALVGGLGPVLYRRLGYAPNARIGWGEDLPRGVAADWFSWCQRPDYFAELLREQGRERFDDVHQPILSLGFRDDPIATERNIDAQLQLYTAADVTRRILHPREVGLRRIGHLHFFSPQMPERLWRLPLSFLLQS